MRIPDNEIRNITRYLEEGKPLPDKYRFQLFGDKREVELVWNGKTNEVCNVVLPFQTIEQVDEPRSEKEAKLQLDFFDLDGRGRQIKGWTNKLVWGDNKLILSSLKNGPLRDEIEAQGGIKLIYIDPPFDVGADFSMNVEIGDEQFTKQPSVLEELAYNDTWGKGTDSFIAMIYERLSLMHGLLSPNASIFVHCDWRVNSVMRLALDEIFGKERFVNEIIWYYYNKFQGNINRFASNHDTIFWYSKDIEYEFNKQKEKRDKTVKQIKRVWDKEKGSIVNAKDEKGNILYIETDERTADDVWRISMLQPADRKENMFYPTQKPEALVQRAILAASNEGDLIADFFCGAGTTLATAEKLGRKWIGADLGKFAIHTSRKRLIDVQRQLRKEGANYRAFEILNLGKYERQYYLGVNPNLTDVEKQKQASQKEKNFVAQILYAYRAEPVEGFLTIVGKKSARLVSVGPINLPVSRLFVEEVINECLEKKMVKVDILAFEFEMGLFPNVQEEAKAKGIDLILKYIPRDVFDKRAIEKNQVVFHDVSYIEVKPQIKKTSVAIELTDFSVFYNQDAVANVDESLKNGSNKIIISNGQIIKVVKDKNGIIKREVLTKKWSDWIDYWAVDFDFESKKEIARTKNEKGQVEETWTGDYIFENEWQSFRTKKDRSLELTSTFHECPKGRRKIAIKVVDIFGNDTMKVIEVTV